MTSGEHTGVLTFLFTDIEGSTRLWEQEPVRMTHAHARHDAIARAAVEAHHGRIVKMTGDGIHAAFNDPLDAVATALELQQALAKVESPGELALSVRCGLDVGVVEPRDNDYFGTPVNRAARIMAAAHGGQVLVSDGVALFARDRLPPGVSLRDLGILRFRDLSGPARIHQLAHADLRPDFPPLRSLETTPNNLPQQVSSFVGRELELAEIRQLLATARLVTLVGAGGIGKTRLSLQVAADMIDEYPDGVWFVELGALTDARLVPQAVASVLSIREEAGRPVIETLVTQLRSRSLLLILDNCEHLVHACAQLATYLLRSGPNVKILASSREGLHILGEHSFPVPALEVPESAEATSLESLTQSDAVRLFVDRARAVQPSFRLTGENAPAVVAICRHLDGIPLAIELAAARTQSLAVKEIASRLTASFGLLARGDRTVLPRQQTLRALIDWSHGLLTEQERTLFRGLAVFAGGWTLDAAEALLGDHETDKAYVVELLSNLVEKSLVVLDSDSKRYRLLETVRQYAQERLLESGEDEPIRTRHLAFYLSLAEKAQPKFLGPEQGAWLTRFDLERENLLAAHAWCGHVPGGGELDLKLAHCAKQYWINRGLLGLGYRLAIEALDRPGAQERNLARCRGLFNAGQACCFMGRYLEAVGYIEESRAVAGELGNDGRVAAALQLLGFAALGRGDLATARGYLEEALDLARKVANPRELAIATNALAQLHRLAGNLDVAEPLYADSLALARELGDRENIAIALLNLAMVAILRGAAERGSGMLLETLTLAEEIGSKPAGQSALEVCAGLAVLGEDWLCAARFFGAAEAQTAQTGLHRDPADEAFLAPLIAKARHAAGAEGFAAAESAGRTLSYQAAFREARAWLETHAGVSAQHVPARRGAEAGAGSSRSPDANR